MQKYGMVLTPYDKMKNAYKKKQRGASQPPFATF